MSARDVDRCLGCSGLRLETLLDLGPQPPSNRFYAPGERQTDRHPLVLAQCADCALVQLVDPMPVEMVRPRYDWLTYNEPEGHLDSLVDELITSRALSSSARIIGLSYKDDTTLGRFNRRGFAGTYRYDMASDLGVRERFAGLETLQLALTDGLADALAARHGLADVLLVRHVLEHAHDPRRFLRTISRLVKLGGAMVLETPESTKFLTARDYSFIWEEHTAYFTPATMQRVIRGAGLEPSRILMYGYALEDSLIAVVPPADAPEAGSPATAGEIELGRAFGEGFESARVRTRAELQRFGGEGKRTAVFGAGHLAAKFLNFFDLQHAVHSVVDDNPHKLGLLMPGSGVKIRPSSVLIDEKIDLCLTSLSPESEAKVIAAQRVYLAQGGEFRSIFPLSRIAYQPHLT